MPLSQAEPFQSCHGEEEEETQQTGGQHQSEQVIGLKLAVGISDGIPQPTFADGVGTGEEFARHRTDHRYARRNA
jgi:hypothetical protein